MQTQSCASIGSAILLIISAETNTTDIRIFVGFAIIIWTQFMLLDYSFATMKVYFFRLLGVGMHIIGRIYLVTRT